VGAESEEDRVTDRPNELFSVRGAAIWLQRNGVQVHENTVRHWVKTDKLPVERRPKGGVLIAVGVLEHIVHCPLCSHR
jgi:hypothetical protein